MENMKFEFKIIEKNDFVVVTFKGRISKESREVIQACHSELNNFTSKTIIFFFKDVTGVDVAVSRDFTLLQQDVRKNNKLYLVGLSLNLKLELNEKGLIRLREVRGSLEEVLKK